MEIDDGQLVKDSLAGNEASFEALVSKYLDPVHRFAYRLIGDREAAQDVTQETFLKVWKSLSRFRSGESFRAWIFTIARNTATDYLRKKKSITFSKLSNDDFAFETTVASDEDLPDETLAKLQDTQALQKVLHQLPIEYQTVLILHYQEDLTFDEIGKTMDKPLNTVKSWHRRALLKLRELTEPDH